jgi:hypothetical protein
MAGPMSKYPDNGFAHFDYYTKQWRERYPSCVFISPAEVDRTLGYTEEMEEDRETYLTWDIPIIRTCNGIICLPFWRESQGFFVEAQEGLRLGLQFWDADGRFRNGGFHSGDDITDEVRAWVETCDWVWDADGNVDLCSDITEPAIRTFDTGAVRDIDTDKLDYEACLSPRVLRRFAEYMKSKTVMADGSTRSADNWQKGFPFDSYMKSMARHFHAVWEDHREGEKTDGDMEEDLCALLFNVMGYLHEWLKPKEVVLEPEEMEYTKMIAEIEKFIIEDDQIYRIIEGDRSTYVPSWWANNKSEMTGDWDTFHG